MAANKFDKEDKPPKKYCPFCQRFIEASNKREVELGIHDGYIFVHDGTPHDEDFDFKPLH
ncbi:TPA: hypothetical protein ACVU5P_004220 [Vibrio parahaemolyticus]